MNTLDESMSIRSEQVTMLYQGMKTSIPVSLIIVVAILYIQQDVIEANYLIYWGLAIVISNLFRLLSLFLYLKNALPKFSINHWYVLFNLSWV